MTRPWRLGSSAASKPGPLVTIWEQGEGEPHVDGRRDGDRLVGCALKADAVEIVRTVNERPWLAPGVKRAFVEAAAAPLRVRLFDQALDEEDE